MKIQPPVESRGCQAIDIQFAEPRTGSPDQVPIRFLPPRRTSPPRPGLLPGPWFHPRTVIQQTLRGCAALVAACVLGLLQSAEAQVVTFDFDTGTPALTTGQSVPLDQTSGGVTAHFSSPQGVAFSVQNDASTLFTMSQFLGNYLYPNRSSADSLTIQFNQQLTNITLAFATTDHAPIEIPNAITLTAYSNSTPVGTPVSAGAAYGTDSLPMGAIAFNSGGAPFNAVTIALVLPGNTPTGFLLDNISVQLSGVISYTITTSASPGAGGTTGGGGTYDIGSSVTVLATANAGYAFVNWTEGGTPVSTSASYTFTADADRALVANFTRIYTITTTASPGAGGSTTGGGVYNSGSNVTVVATANAWFAFLNWTENGVPVSTSASYSFTANANRTLVANFVATCTIMTSTSPSTGGSTSGGGVYITGSNVTVVATANAGFAFVNWTEGGVPVSISASYSFTANANRTLVANFVATYTITTSSLPSVGGTTTGGGTFNSGSNVTVVAAANAGFAFLNWTEGGVAVSTPANYSFTASAPRTLVANFAPRLGMLLTSTNTILISWPTPLPGYVLQERSSFDSAVIWADTTYPVNVVGDQSQVIISAPTGKSFYRLFHP
jgi:hypothetical protein